MKDPSPPPELHSLRATTTTTTTTTNPKGTARGVGLRLLSPTFQLRQGPTTRGPRDNQRDDDPAATCMGRATTTTTKLSKTAVLDLDGLTIEAVRRRHAHEQRQLHHHLGSFRTPTASSSTDGDVEDLGDGGGGSSGSIGGMGASPSPLSSSGRGFARGPASSSSFGDRLTQLEGYETSSVRSLEDFDWGTRSSRYPSASSSTYQPSHAYYAPLKPSVSSSVSGSFTGGRKRLSVASAGSAHNGQTTTMSTQQRVGARVRPTTEVVFRGWLQRRRGRVLKRWKPQFCVLKADDKLCLYASEDVINGKLEGRLQVLRVSYHEKNGSLLVIGLSADETPFKEEFRPQDDLGWRRWFGAFRRYFDAASLQTALEHMPELALGGGGGGRRNHSDGDLDDDFDDVDDDVGSSQFGDDRDFAHEVEELVMRPYYPYGPPPPPTTTTSASTGVERLSHSSSRSASESRPVEPTAESPPPAPGVPARRKTLVRPSQSAVRESRVHLYNNNQLNLDELADDLPAYLHKDEPGVGRTRRAASRSSSQASSPTAILRMPSSRSSSQRSQHSSRRSGSTHVGGSDGLLSGTGLGLDCPMIERDSQTPTMPILEGRTSGSAVSNSQHESDGGFTWNHRLL